MLLTITTTQEPATDLGYLLHKNPHGGPQTFALPCGKAHVFYPEVNAQRTTAALLLDVDPVGLVRGPSTVLSDYVSDRPYAASSFLSVAIARVFGTALSGRSKERPALAEAQMPLTATIAAAPCRGGDELPAELFGPLGYEVEATADGEGNEASPYRNIRLRHKVRLADLLRHLYVLLPVLDDRKHYWVGDAEVGKLVEKGKGWLEKHPARKMIIQRALGGMKLLTSEAAARLSTDEEAKETAGAAGAAGGDVPTLKEQRLDLVVALMRVTTDAAARLSTDEKAKETAGAAGADISTLNEQRLDSVVATLQQLGVRTVIDIGCGEGRLLEKLMPIAQFTQLTGADASPRALERAARRLRLKSAPPAQLARVKLIQTGLTYRDERLSGYDAAALVEVVEHIDVDRLAAFERVLFEMARPRIAVTTTPNREYNAVFKDQQPNGLRHPDHRFEWTRAEFEQWAAGCGRRFGYRVETGGIGTKDENLGHPTQKAVFKRCD